MKRSEINRYIRAAERFFADYQVKLPPWAHWSPAEWRGRDREEVKGIVEVGLGWDLTDFGLGAYQTKGLLLFTVRNGLLGDPHKTYAEKIMIVGEGQVTPFHFHWKKTEDIIVRGGGNLVVELYNSDESEGLRDDEVTVTTDGIKRTVAAGDSVVLTPGESVTLEPYLYHKFYGQAGRGTVLVGEVSTVNDDNKDNRFYDSVGRFPEIEEDEAPYRLLVKDYDRIWG